MTAEDFKKLFPKKLEEIWKNSSDQSIAYQYGITKTEVTKRRKEFEIRLPK